MDAKNVAEESPPPYTIYASDAKPTHESSIDSNSGYSESATSHLQHHLASLPTRMRRTQQVHSLRQSLDDASLLDFLVPEIENFLAHIGNLATTPKLAHLTLVPEYAIPSNAVLSSMEELRRRGELCQVVRVSVYPSHSNMGCKVKSSGDKKKPEADEDGEGQTWTTGQEFSDWGRFGESSSSADDSSSQAQGMLWWKDEDMAHRLARHLQPETQKEPPVLDTPVQMIVEERLPSQKEKKGWFWGRKGSNSSAPAFATKAVEKDVRAVLPERSGDAADSNGRRDSNQKQKQKQQTGAMMTVTAEEVAFRTENDFGIMESRRGWAVVVVVHVRT